MVSVPPSTSDAIDLLPDAFQRPQRRQVFLDEDVPHLLGDTSPPSPSVIF